MCCGPPAVRSRGELSKALRRRAQALAPHLWIRGVGYDESVAGSLDRVALDSMVSDHPMRVQHRSGALWILNTRAIDILGLQEHPPPVASALADDLTAGRLWRLDRWMREQLSAVGEEAAADLTRLGRQLAAFGITGVTDATPDLAASQISALLGAVERGEIAQRLQLLGAASLPVEAEARTRIQLGPLKIVIADHDLPGLGDLVASITSARRRRRAVALHCVTAEAVALAIAALEEVGAVAGDRVEHGAVVAPDAATSLRQLGVAVVTQPGFIADHGDHYLARAARADLEHLYPYASLLAAGVRVAPSSDAPYGPLDPWYGLAAASDRQTRAGLPLGRDEGVPVKTALSGLLSPLGHPGGAPRTVRVEATADLCLLHVPLEQAMRSPDAGVVRMTLCDGEVVYDSDDPHAS